MFIFAFIVIISLLPAIVVSQSLTPNPAPIPCPSEARLVRFAGAPANQRISEAERSYISSRTKSVLPHAWKAYLENIKDSSPSPLPKYVSKILTRHNSLPRIGIAISGGGFRAALFGAGVLSSLDGRNETAACRKGTGGLLQAATYLSGLSAGAWMVGALAQANFPTIPDLVFPPPSSGFGGFLAQFDLITPSSNPIVELQYVASLMAETLAKFESSGLPPTITDPWSRILSRHFVNGTTAQDITSFGSHGSGILFSGIANLSSFRAYAQPFPIIVMDSIPPHPDTSAIIPNNLIPANSEIYEVNVYETGSFDPALSSFLPTSLLGSTNASNCFSGFDQVGFVMAMSSNVWNELNSSAGLGSSPIGSLISAIEAEFPKTTVRLDSAAVPNPFKGINPGKYSNTNETFLALVDGGEDGQILPLQPLLVKARGIDTIIAVDGGGDTADNFANGSSIINSAKRAALFKSQYRFPKVPATPEEFLQQGLTKQPTFFGCNESKVPMVIYISNGAPPLHEVPVTNTSFTQNVYSTDEVQKFLDQTFLISTQGKHGTDREWGACLGCAVVDRMRARLGFRREGICVTCFERYCWDGVGASIGPTGAGGKCEGDA